MRILFIGGTGTISSACTALALERGYDVTLLNRGKKNDRIPRGAHTLTADINDPSAAKVLEGKTFDAVVNWIVYTPDQIERDIALFRGKTQQYVFISSASVYKKPPAKPFFTEDMPIENAQWDYSHQKILCEQRLFKAHRTENFPITIVRPSHTYGPGLLPAAFNNSAHPWTIIDRLRRGKKLIVHGDGSSLWTLTFNTDFAKGFVPLLGNPKALGDIFHITSPEALTWNTITELTAQAAGTTARIVHVSSETLDKLTPGGRGTLLGDKMHCALFDNTKIQRLAPDFTCTIPFSEGVKKSIAWFEADKKRQTVDHEFDKLIDQIIEKVESAGM